MTRYKISGITLCLEARGKKEAKVKAVSLINEANLSITNNTDVFAPGKLKVSELPF